MQIAKEKINGNQARFVINKKKRKLYVKDNVHTNT